MEIIKKVSLLDLKYYENLSLKNLWVIDVEQFLNFHSLCAYELKTGKQLSFVISEYRDDRISYLKWLKSGVNWITFNGMNYDYPLVHRIIKFENFFLKKSIDVVLDWLYKTGQRIISSEQSAVKESESYIKQYDLYRIFHFNNKAKSSSLKHIEFVLRWKLLQDLPFKFNSRVDKADIPKILSYNFNDVFATLELWKLAIDQNKISIRETLSKEYKINLRNADDVKIGSNLFAKILSKDMNIDMSELLKMRTILHEVHIKDLLLDMSFESKELKIVHNYFLNKTVINTKNAFHIEQKYRNVKLVYGTGGIHSLSDPGVYESNEDFIIIDVDVSSFYPNLSIVNDFKPHHLGNSFTKIYKHIYEERKVIPKSNPLNLAYKLMLNGSYGKSNSEHSFLYDKSFMLSITTNGQLLLSKLIEMLCEPFSEQDVQIIAVNTDGVTLRLRKSLKPKILDISKEWEKLTNLELEYAYYSKVVQRDCNNYLAIYCDEEGNVNPNKVKIKTKGAFEIDKELHKNHSSRIIPICLLHYFVNKTPSQDIINNYLEFSNRMNSGENSKLIVNGNPIIYHGIYDFFKEVKSKTSDKKGDSEIIFMNVSKGIISENKLQKINRYLVSNRGGRLLKKYKSDKNASKVVAGKFNISIYNDLNFINSNSFSDLTDQNVTSIYNSINKRYYTSEIVKIIDSVNKTQSIKTDINFNNSQQLKLF
jgi:hypothetical protein